MIVPVFKIIEFVKSYVFINDEILIRVYSKYTKIHSLYLSLIKIPTRILLSFAKRKKNTCIKILSVSRVIGVLMLKY